MNLQSLGDHGWSNKLIVRNLFTELVLCRFVEQDKIVQLVPNFAFGPLLLLGLATRFIYWVFVFVLANFLSSFSLSSLGGMVKL